MEILAVSVFCTKARLEESLDGVVEYCVNTVGVDLNTASAPLLERVSGLNKTTAKNIVSYREENGRFTKRNQLLKVSKLGPKAYMLSAGFLRIPGAKDKLDSSSVHPESYDVAKKLLAAVGYTSDDIGTEKIKNLPEDVAAEFTMDIFKDTITPVENQYVPSPFQGLTASLAEFQTLLADSIAENDPKLFAAAIDAYPVNRFDPKRKEFLQKMFDIYTDVDPAMRKAADYIW
jgi:competence ComEA-like helix-hairpin-helix protein